MGIFFTKIKVCIICFWHGTPTLCATQHSWRSPYVWSSRSNAHGEPNGPWRVLCQLKKLFTGLRSRQGSYWEEQKKKVVHRWGAIHLLSRQINDIYIKETYKIELVARPTPLQTDTTRSIFHHQHIQRKKPYFNVVFRPSNASSHTLWCLIEEVLY